MIHQEKLLIPIQVIPNPDSIGEIVAGLKTRGYQLKFRRETTCVNCIELNRWIMPDSFMVDEYYHFEDTLNTDRDRTLYAISSIDGLKGFLIDACFVYEDNISPEMTQKLQFE
ncbi:hypothetical protein [Flavitalea sp.]|nr:hypothetical protein [Flavitalea sp.]